MPFGNDVAQIMSGLGEHRIAFAPHKSQISGNFVAYGFASSANCSSDICCLLKSQKLT